jgi:hypothetical protein
MGTGEAIKKGGRAKTHNIQFAELQEEYLKTRDPECLGKMYPLCVEVASNYIRKYARTRGLQLDIPELSHDSAIYAIEQYLKKPDFKINYIATYMRFGALKSMFRDKEHDQWEVSFDDLLLNEEAAHAEDTSLDEGGPGLLAGFPIGATKPRAAPQGDRHEPAVLKQGLLFEESDTEKQ